MWGHLSCRPKLRGCPFCSFVDVWRHRTLLQCVAQLGAQEATGSITGDAGVEAVDEAPHHGRIFVKDVGEDFKVIVIDDGVDLVGQWGQFAFHRATNLFILAANAVTFEIDEEQVVFLVVGEPLLDRHAQQLVAQTHGAGCEDALIHDRGVTYDRLKLHPGQNVAYTGPVQMLDSSQDINLRWHRLADGLKSERRPAERMSICGWLDE